MRKVFAIALNTYREAIRSKILYIVLFFALVVLLISTFFGTVTIGDQIKVIKDFGLFSITLFSAAYVVITGASLLHKELQRKTIYNILGKAVYRSQFLLGKYLGLLMTATMLVALMSAGLLGYLYLFEARLDYTILYAAFFLVLELAIICAAAIFFASIVVTPVLAGLFTFGIFIAGRSTQYLSYFSEEIFVVKVLQYLLPNLDKLNVANDIVFGNVAAISSAQMLWSGIYSLSYAAALLLLSSFIFNYREFN